MSKGYFVYSGIEYFKEPVASFTVLDDAQHLSRLIGSHSEPLEITGDNPTELDYYLPQIRSGKQVWDVALLGDGTLFELDNGLEGVGLGESSYNPEGDGAFCGSFWADNSAEAIELAVKEL